MPITPLQTRRVVQRTVGQLAGKAQSGDSVTPRVPADEVCDSNPAVVKPAMPSPERLVLCPFRGCPR